MAVLNYLRKYKYMFFRSLGIPKDMVFTGDFMSASSGAVGGKIIGNIQLKGTLVIKKDASVEGVVHASTVVVLGKVTGEIIAVNKVVVESGGRVTGKIEAPAVKIYELGIVETTGIESVTAPVYDIEDPKVTGIIAPTRVKGNYKTWF